jgi:2,4-dienoyl-CoA reductase (NADPH2)
VEEALQIFAWAEAAGLNAMHVSAGSTFPHPLVPPGGFPLDETNWWYGVMCLSGTHGYLNYTLFHFPWLRWIFRLIWNRTKKQFPIEGVTASLCKLVKNEAVARAAARNQKALSEEAKRAGAVEHIPILNTGGYQNGALIRKVITEGNCDGVAIARPLIANNDLVNGYFMKGKDLPEKPCTFCNRCLINALANPLACYDETRFNTREDMIREAMSVFPPTYER